MTTWADGGQTNERNLIALCCRHHLEVPPACGGGKHDAGWTVKRLPDRGVQWTSPTGHTYTVPASTYPIDTTYDTYVPDDNAEHPPEEADPDPPTDDDSTTDDEPTF